MGQSVVALVDGANQYSDNLPVDLAEGRRSAHCGLIQHFVRDKGPRVQRVNRHDVVDPFGLRVDDAVSHLSEFAVPFFVFDGLNPAHMGDLTSEDQARIHVVKRVAVVGSPGSGKSTVAKTVSSALGVPHLELDSVFHQPGWTELPTDEFQDAVRTFTDGAEWVVDGNYTNHGITDLVWPRADTGGGCVSRGRSQKSVVRAPHPTTQLLGPTPKFVTQSPSSFPCGLTMATGICVVPSRSPETRPWSS